MQRIEAIAAAPKYAIPDPVPLIDADPKGAYRLGEGLNNYIPNAFIDAAIADMVAIQDAAAHAVIDGPASAQRSC